MLISITTDLHRGNVVYRQRRRLSRELQLEWDAWRELLLRLSVGRHLYIGGSFCDLPEGLPQHIAVQGRKRWIFGTPWIASLAITSGADLERVWHGEIGTNFHYAITDTELPTDEAATIAHVKVAGGVHDHVWAVSEHIYASLYEGSHSHKVQIVCQEENADAIIQVVVEVAQAAGVERSLAFERTESLDSDYPY